MLLDTLANTIPPKPRAACPPVPFIPFCLALSELLRAMNINWKQIEANPCETG